MTAVEHIAVACREWAVPRAGPVEPGSAVPAMAFACRATPRDGHLELPESTPNDLRVFYASYDSVRLFEDITHGQWGLELFGPNEAARRTLDHHYSRPDDACRGDLVIGKLLGDAGLLLYRNNPSAADHGSIVVAEAIDSRAMWPRPAWSFEQFVALYTKHEGQKFWEYHRRGTIGTAPFFDHHEALRRQVGEIVELLVGERYAALSSEYPEGLREAVEQYGRTLVAMPIEGWEFVHVYVLDDGTGFAFVVPLWTKEEGLGELVLSLTARRIDDRFGLTLTNLRVQ